MKKFIVLIVAVAMFLSVGTTAFAFADTNQPFLFKTANATPIIDGVKDEAYNGSDVVEVAQVGLPSLPVEGQATAKVWTLWDDTNIYVYAEVNDTTPSIVYFEGINTWMLDSVELYLDFANTKDGKASIHKQDLTGQFRFCRTPEYSVVEGTGLYTTEIKDKVEFKVIDNGAEGYVVEVAVPHRDLAQKVGFSFQINDDMDDDQIRDATTFVKDMGYLACQYNRVFDTLELEGCTSRNGLEDDTIVYNTYEDFLSMGDPATPPESTQSSESVESTEPTESTETVDSTAPVESTDAPSSEPQADNERISPLVWVAAGVVAAAVIVAVVIAIVKNKKSKQ